MFDFITETLDRRNLLTPGRKDEDEDEDEVHEDEGVEEQKELVGSLIEVCWSDDEEFYKAKATIESYDLRKDLLKIVYVDGGVERLKLNQVRWRFVNASQKDSPIGCQETEEMPLRKKIKRTFSTNSDDSDGSGSSSKSAGKFKDDSGEGEGEDADLYDQNEVRWRGEGEDLYDLNEVRWRGEGEGEDEDADLYDLNEVRWRFVNGKDTGCQETEEMPLRKKIKRNFSTNNSDDSDGSGSSSKSAGKSKDDTDGVYSTDDSYKPTTDLETESSEGTQTPLEEVVRYVNVTKTLNLRVDSFENIDDVKDKYSEFEGIETKVFFTKGGFENAQELDFDRKDGSNVHLNLHLGVRLQINVKVSWSTTADKLISLDVHSWDTISDVKTKFQNKEGTPANQLTLFYNRKQLDDLQTLTGYDIRNHSTLDAFSLGEEKIVISVSPPDKDPIEVMVKLCSTVMTLKRMIHCMGLFAVDRQKLTFNGVLLENGQTLADYKVQKGSELGLDFIRRTNGMKIFVKTMTGKIHTIYMDSSDTVNTLKTKIKYLEGAPEDRQILMFAGKLLHNDGTLGGYDIRKECTVHVIFKRYDY